LTKRSAMSRQTSALLSLLCFFRELASSRSSGFVGLAFFTLSHLDFAFKFLQMTIQYLAGFGHYPFRRKCTRRFKIEYKCVFFSRHLYCRWTLWTRVGAVLTECTGNQIIHF